MKFDLDQRLAAALQPCAGELPRIAREAGVSYSWITKFRAGKIPNPTYNQLSQLAAALQRLGIAFEPSC